MRPDCSPQHCSFLVALLTVLALGMAFPGDSNAGSEKYDETDELAFSIAPQPMPSEVKASKIYPSRYRQPEFYGKSLPKTIYKGFTLIGTHITRSNTPDNASFFSKIRQSIDLIEQKAPQIYRLMHDINPRGRRVIVYSGMPGPASFVAWGKDYIANITASSLDEDPVFENSKYSLSATLVHEMVGHGSQENDGRVWAMYDWCGKSKGKIKGVAWQLNYLGSSSGLVEYEANLYARWFLESVRGTYPNLNEVPIRRYVKLVRIMQKRFPGWYDEGKSSVTLLKEFKPHFKKVCPGLQYTSPRISNG